KNAYVTTFIVCLMELFPKKEPEAAFPPPRVFPFRLVADDASLDEARTSQRRRDDAVASVFDVVATAHARTKNNTHHLAIVFEILTHALDLTVVALDERVPGGLSDVDVAERNVDGVLGELAAATAVGITPILEGLAHVPLLRAEAPGAASTSY